jgi:hypothetical protein
MINPEQPGLSDYSAEAPGPIPVTFVLFVVNPLPRRQTHEFSMTSRQAGMTAV